MTIGGRIREIRQGRHLTLRELSRNCGVSVSHLSDIERGTSSPSPQTVLRIAHALQQPPSAIIEGADDWDAENQLAIESIMALRQQQTPEAEQQPLRESRPIPPNLLALREDALIGPELTQEWLDWLASLSFQGQQPTTTRDWLTLHIVLRSVFKGESR